MLIDQRSRTVASQAKDSLDSGSLLRASAGNMGYKSVIVMSRASPELRFDAISSIDVLHTHSPPVQPLQRVLTYSSNIPFGTGSCRGAILAPKALVPPL